MPPYLLEKLEQLFLSSLLITLLGIPRTASFPAWHVCPTDASYLANSTFHTNLNLLLSSLSSNAPPNRFFNDTKGQSPDQVYGLALCQDDMTPDDCWSCLTAAINDTVQVCPQGKRYAAWYFPCFLRYSDEIFFSSVNTSSADYIQNTGNVSDPTSFDQLLGNLMGNLTMEAAYRSGGRMFAVGAANYTSSQKLYGMVMCTRDLSDDACHECLRARVGDIPSCCRGRQGARVMAWSCYLRFEMYPFYNLSYNADQALGMPPSVSASPSPATGNTSTPPPESTSTAASNGKNSHTVRTILFITIPTIVAIVLFFVKKKLRVLISKFCVNSSSVLLSNGGVSEGGGMREIREVDLLFDLGTLRAATDNFSDANKLGEGGFGPVYKGLLSNGEEIAVKRLSRSSSQGLVELRNEVGLVARLQHRNLVRLLGFCLEEEEKMVVYEYLPNKSLDKLLFDPTQRQKLHWGNRFKIIEGIARGLLYLHEDSRLRIVHRDLKASNILLDKDMNPKISDFGLAKLFHVEETHGNTSRIAGTYGYLAPEYAIHGRFSTKSDVFSFGVLALEIVTGQRNSGFQGSESVVDLLGHVWLHWHEGRALQLRDPNLSHQYLAEEVLRCIQIGLLCVQEDPYKRPSMASIVLMLSSFSVTLPAPSRPAFFTPGSVTSESDSLARNTNLDLPQTDHPNGSLSEFRSNSKNDLSISEMDPR